jgi:hypothetical protein
MKVCDILEPECKSATKRRREMRIAKCELPISKIRISHFAFPLGVGKQKKRIDNGVVADPRCGSVRILLLRLLALGRRMLVCDSLVVPVMMMAPLVGAGCHG